MVRTSRLSAEDLVKAIVAAGPRGATPDALAERFAHVSRSSLNRRLRELVVGGRVKPVGRGRATRYVSAAPFVLEEVLRYFETDWQARPVAGFREDLLLPQPGIDPEKARRLEDIQGRPRGLDKKFLADFLIDFSWASSLLEGSTYSSIDTQALIEYGERNPDKPVEDAVLVLNHKNAIQHLWTHRDLTPDNLCRIQALLTDRHGLAEAEASDHFLPDAQRGVVREYEDVRLGRSAYSPPFRPGTGYIAKALAQITATATALAPIPAALYLMTRIPYLQAFANGNKRTARLAANLPLLQAGLLPISFVDFPKAEYVTGMSAFYELGDVQVIENCFIRGYARSIVRGSDIPAGVRAAGFNVGDAVSELAAYVQSGRAPASSAARLFLLPPPGRGR